MMKAPMTKLVPACLAAICLLVLCACSNVEVPDLDADVRDEKIIPEGWQPLRLRVGLAPFRYAPELDEKRYNIEDTTRWVLVADEERLNGAGGLHSQLMETLRAYRMFEAIQPIQGATPDASREELQAAALRQGLDLVIVPTLRRQDVGYVDSNGAYGWNMFVWWMVSPIFSWWIADEDFDVNLHMDLRAYPTTRDLELDWVRLQPPETIVRSLDDWDEGWNLFSIFSTPNHFDEDNWTRIGELLMPIAENEAKKAALRYVTTEFADKSRGAPFLDGIRRRVALVVGVDGTGQPPLPLSRYAVDDAQAFAAQLIDARNEAVPEGALRTLTGPRATPRAVSAAADDLSALARYNDDVFVVFSGLGGLDASNRPALVLAQVPGVRDVQMIAIEELLDSLLKNRPRTLTLVLDCSFVTPGDKRCATTPQQLEALLAEGANGSLLQPIIDRVEARGTRCIILSATDAMVESPNHMPALEIEDLGHGLFTSFALEALGGAADANGDRLVSFEEFSTWVGEKVSHISGLEGRPQSGWFHAPEDRKSYALPSWRR
jgi:hypothetical protein